MDYQFLIPVKKMDSSRVKNQVWAKLANFDPFAMSSC